MLSSQQQGQGWCFLFSVFTFFNSLFYVPITVYASFTGNLADYDPSTDCNCRAYDNPGICGCDDKRVSRTVSVLKILFYGPPLAA